MGQIEKMLKTTEELFKIMQSGGMTKEDFDNCINNVEIRNKYFRKHNAAQNEFNIKSTPSFLIKWSSC